MSSTDVLNAVRSALETIARNLRSVEFLVPGPARTGNESRRTATAETISQYLLHRLREPDAPVVAAVVGLSGVGKSTIVNTLAQEPVSATGVVRPTTRHAVLWAHRDHAARYWTEFVSRVRDHVGSSTDVVIGDDPLTRFLTVIDTPPVEMSPGAEASSAIDVLMFADLCVFVTSVERYADAAQLAFLESARARGIPILFVLNRLPTDSDERGAMLTDFAEKLVAAGLIPHADPAFIFGIDDVERPRWHGGLGPENVAALRKELSEVSDVDFRSVVVDEAAEAALLAVTEEAARLASAIEEERLERDRLAATAERHYGTAITVLLRDLGAGRFADLARYEVWSQASVDLAAAATRAAGLAAAATTDEWSRRPGGEGLLESGHEGLRRHGAGAAAASREFVDAWHETLGEGIRESRSRIRKRKLRRVRLELWRCVLDPDRSGRYRRIVTRELILGARPGLAEALTRALELDGARFARRLGSPIPEHTAQEIADAVAYLRGLPEPVPAPAGGPVAGAG
jgi:hypothetical protein